MFRLPSSTAGWVAVLAVSLALPAWAQHVTPPADPHPLPTREVFAAAPLADDGLAAQRGGAETTNDMELSGVVGSNHASDLLTGHNIVSEGSLTGNAGFATVVQNSGNNVLIQNATIINLHLQ